MPPPNQSRVENAIRCASCGKVIGKGFIVEGSVELPCKCGVRTRIEAKKKPEGRVQERTAIKSTVLGVAR
jgi:phage FluMu protein Com